MGPGSYLRKTYSPMKTDAMRNELIQWINNLDDQTLLGSLMGIMKATRKDDWANDVSAEEQRSIERGLEDLKSGRKVSSEDFWAEHGR